MSFEKPIKFGRLKSSSSTNKKFVYTPDSFDKVLAPYDGHIDEIDLNKDDGFIKIKHNVDGETIYSELKGVTKNSNDLYISWGKDVKKGEELAKAGTTDIEFQIKDKERNFKNIDPYFSLSPKKDEKKGEKKSEEKKSEEKKSEEKKNEKNKLKDDDSEGWNLNRKASELPSLFTTALLSPLSLVNQIFSSKKETKEEEEKLMEEIKRIKQLLK